jgi:hypothetical protein
MTDQATIDREASEKRESDLKAAADSLEASRKAEDEVIAQRRLEEDEALADARTAQDRVVASSRNRLTVAAEAMQVATDSGDPAEVAAANAEIQAAVTEHLNTVPEEQPA